MVSKSIFLLVVVCFTQTVMPRRYTKGRGLSNGRSVGDRGAIMDCLPIEPLHIQLAQFAVKEIDPGNTLLQILGVRTQVVAGMMYYMELLVSESGTPSEGKICKNCDVEVWLQVGGQYTLEDQHCKETCCRLQSNVLRK